MCCAALRPVVPSPRGMDSAQHVLLLTGGVYTTPCLGLGQHQCMSPAHLSCPLGFPKLGASIPHFKHQPFGFSPDTAVGEHLHIQPSCRGAHGAHGGMGALERLFHPPRKAARVPTDHGGLQVHKHRSWHVLASPSLAEERVEGVIPSADGFVTWHLAIGLNSVFKAVQLPAGIADLDACLPHVDRDALALGTRA